MVANMDDALRYVLAVVEHGNLSRAAEAQLISQPALSRYIGRLEKQVGAKLVNRDARPVTLTTEGLRYRDYLMSVEQLRTAMQSDIEGMSQNKSEYIQLGASVWRSSTILPDVIADVLKRRPDLHINIFEGSNSQINAGLRARKLDIAVLNSTYAGAGVNYTAVATESIVLAGRALPAGALQWVEKPSKRNDLMKYIRTFLCDKRLILLHPDHHMGGVSRDFLSSINIDFSKSINTHNIITAVRLAARGVGLVLAPEGAVREHPDLPYVRIGDNLTQSVGVAMPVGFEPSKGVQALADTLAPAIRATIRGQASRDQS